MRRTFHLTATDWWAGADPSVPLTAPSLDLDGFIHCTDGAAEMVETANRHYRSDRRAFVVLTIDLDRVSSPWTVEDAAGIYPHIHGPIDRAAILSTVAAPRDPDGAFLAFEA